MIVINMKIAEAKILEELKQIKKNGISSQAFDKYCSN